MSKELAKIILKTLDQIEEKFLEHQTRIEKLEKILKPKGQLGGFVELPLTRGYQTSKSSLPSIGYYHLPMISIVCRLLKEA